MGKAHGRLHQGLNGVCGSVFLEEKKKAKQGAEEDGRQLVYWQAGGPELGSLKHPQKPLWLVESGAEISISLNVTGWPA